MRFHVELSEIPQIQGGKMSGYEAYIDTMNSQTLKTTQ